MEKANNYEYSVFDGLKKPQTYQYSKYEGFGFITAYNEARMAIADLLKSKYIKSIKSSKEQDINLLAECCYFQSFFTDILDEKLTTELRELTKLLKNTSQKNKLKSELIIKNWTESLKKPELNLNSVLKETFLVLKISDGNKIKKELYFLLSKFLKKYEVDKKLYEEYTADFKNITENYDLLTNYILLSITLISYYQKDQNLKFINTALKLNDLICSVQHRLESPLDLILAYIALTLEKKEIKKLFDKNGIKNEIR